jgi:hypothetical protein
MANLFLTNQCGRKCSFCFAREGPWSGSYPARPLTMREALAFVDLKTATNQRERGILGGEPLTHPGLSDIIEAMWERSLTPKLFTSGLHPTEGRIPNEIKGGFRVIVNVGPWESYSSEAKRNLHGFFRAYGRYTSLSCTLLDPASPPLFLLEYISEYKLTPMIRISLALPATGKKNQYVLLEQYRDMALSIVEFSEKAAVQRVAVGMDCGFVACMFTIDEIGRLQRLGVDVSFICKPVVDVGPDLQSWHCFPLSKLPLVSLRDCSTIEEAALAHAKQAMSLRESNGPGLFPRCAGCRYLRRRQCGGGCLGFLLSDSQSPGHVPSGYEIENHA